LIDDEKVVGEKAFKWEKEFKQVMDEGGFDVVIGNPPYVRVDNLRKEDKEYWSKIFNSPEGKYDLYYLFIEKALMLLKDGGKCGFIVPNKWCAAFSAKKLRQIIFESTASCDIISVSNLDVFKDAANYPVIIILTKGKDPLKKIKVSSVFSKEDFLNQNFISYSLSKQHLSILPLKIIPINIGQKQFDLIIKLLNNREKIQQYLKISEGLRIPGELETKKIDKFEIVKQYQFDRYSEIERGSYISENNLRKVISFDSERYRNSQKNKILIAEDALRITCTIDEERRIPQGRVYFGVLVNDDVSLKYIISLLNSKLLSFIYKMLFGGMHMGGGYLRYRTEFLEQLPIQKTSKDKQNRFEEKVDKITSLIKSLKEMGDKKTDERIRIEEEIKRTDAEIDELVYQLYGITEEEKKIIEESLK